MTENDRLNLQKVSPEGLQALVNVEKVIARSGINKMLTHLVKLRVSQINGCVYCVGLHNEEARADDESQERLDHLVVWRDSDLFTPAERASLAWGEAFTIKGGPVGLDQLHAELREHLSEKDIGMLMLVIVMIHAWNRIQVAAHGSRF